MDRDGPHRYEEGGAGSGADGPAGCQARPAWRRSVRVPEPRGVAGQDHLARRDRHVALRQPSRAGAVHMALGAHFAAGHAASAIDALMPWHHRPDVD